MRILFCVFCTALALGLWLTGCGGSSSDGGRVKLLIADAPLDGVSAVNICITRVDLLYDGAGDTQQDDATNVDTEQTSAFSRATGRDSAGAGPITIFTGSQTINLLDYANQPMSNLFQLVAASVPPGHYSQLRLYLADTGNTIVVDTGSSADLTVPSGFLRVPFNFTVDSTSTQTIVLDFNLAESLLAPTQGHGWKLKPVLHISRPAATGDITGTLSLPDGTLLAQPVDVTITATATGGMTVNSVVTFTADAGGLSRTYYLHGLPPGTVTLSAAYGGQTFDLGSTTVYAGQQAQVTATLTGFTP